MRDALAPARPEVPGLAIRAVHWRIRTRLSRRETSCNAALTEELMSDLTGYRAGSCKSRVRTGRNARKPAVTAIQHNRAVNQSGNGETTDQRRLFDPGQPG
jgi:hypothetical protein